MKIKQIFNFTIKKHWRNIVSLSLKNKVVIIVVVVYYMHSAEQ